MRLVDTSAWIEYLRGTGSDVASDVERYFLGGELALCDMVSLELWNGARGERERSLLSELHSVIQTVPTDRPVWDLAKVSGARCRASGVTAPATDVLIAACAVRHGLSLLHRDADFDRILPVVREVWATGV